MHPRTCFTGVLFCLTLSAASSLHAQDCAIALRQSVAQPDTHTVSAFDLRIPPNAWQHFEKARTASEQNRPEIVARETRRALAIAPRFPQVFLLRAAQEVHAGNFDTALQTIAAAREIRPDAAWSNVIAAGALNQLHRFDDAIAELDRAERREAESWQAMYERARAETGRHNLQAAVHWSDLAIAAAPTGCTQSRIVRANALQLSGREAEALVELRTYLAEDRQRDEQGGRLEAVRTQVRLRLRRAGEDTELGDSALLTMK